MTSPRHQLTIPKVNHRSRDPAERGKVVTSSMYRTDNQLTASQRMK